MSDDNESDGNYDEYMMSEDEDMLTSSELEFESEDDIDQEDDPTEKSKLNETSQEEIHIDLESMMDIAVAYMDNRDYANSRLKLVEINKNPLNEKQIIELSIANLRLCSLKLQFFKNETFIETIERDVNLVFQNLIKHGNNLPTDFKQEILKLFNTLFFGNNIYENYYFLFCICDSSLSEREKIRERIIFYSILLTKFEWILTLKNDTTEIVYNICEMISFKQLYMRIWLQALDCDTYHQIDHTHISYLQGSIHKDYSTSLKGTSPQLPAFIVPKLNLMLQIYIFNFIATGKSPDEVQLYSNDINYLTKMSTYSLALQQDSELMFILHLSMCINFLPQNMSDDEPPEDDATILTSIVEQINKARNESLISLKKLEEIGYSQYYVDNFKKFHKLILLVFIISTMTLVKLNKIKINPFDFEQIKIIENTPFIQYLHNIYTNFINLDIRAIYTGLTGLDHELTSIITDLIEFVLQMGQTIKLWREIAPNYSCISIDDIRSKLTYCDDIKVSRDDILTILMRSLLKGKAVVYFKIDLTKDLVWFGDNYKVPMTIYPKEYFKLEDKNGENDNEVHNLEYANDVGIFETTPQAVVTSDAHSFFEQLKNIRDVSNTTHETRVKAQQKYMELVNMVSVNLFKIQQRESNMDQS